MLHLIKYRFLQSLRDRSTMFWALAFPMILGTLFYVSFGTGSFDDKFQKIPVAYVSEDTEEESFKSYLSQMDGDLLKLQEMSDEDAKKALKNEKIEGIIYGNETLTVSKNSISSSILETVLNSYVRNASMLKEIASAHPERMQDAVEAVSGYQEMIKKITPDGKTTDTSYSYFFALLAMTCLYGCFPGLQTMMETQANITALGARQCIAPVHKMKRILVSASVTYVVQFVNTVLVLLFLRYILRLEFAGSMAGMLLICLFGSMIGVSFGIVIGALGKMEEGAKVGILIGVSMLLCFFAGLMSPDVKSMVAEKAPIFNNLNPAAVISDAFYCLNVYNDGARLTRCLATLGGMSILLLFAGFLMVRRERYESI